MYVCLVLCSFSHGQIHLISTTSFEIQNSCTISRIPCWYFRITPNFLSLHRMSTNKYCVHHFYMKWDCVSWVEGPRASIMGYQSESWMLGITANHNLRRVSLVAPTVKNPPSMQEKQVQFLDQKDSLEKGMATHSSILAGEFHGQRNLMGYSPWVLKELDMTDRLTQ